MPEVQPGSSIMPGKVNPVIPEARIQVCAPGGGNDATHPHPGPPHTLWCLVFRGVLFRSGVTEITRLWKRESVQSG